MATRKPNKRTKSSKPAQVVFGTPAEKHSPSIPRIADGDDLFPWPWRATSALSAHISDIGTKKADQSIFSTPEHCRAFLRTIVGNTELPATKTFSSYLIRAVGNQERPDGQSVPVVVFLPEFLFVLDLGYSNLAAVEIPWDPRISDKIIGLGDAAFPDFSKARALSLPDESRSAILYPWIAGQIIVKLFDNVSPQIARESLETNGLTDVHITGHEATARCAPFNEKAVCSRLEASAPTIVKYAEPNRIVRLVDVPWSVIRLS